MSRSGISSGIGQEILATALWQTSEAFLHRIEADHARRFSPIAFARTNQRSWQTGHSARFAGSVPVVAPAETNAPSKGRLPAPRAAPYSPRAVSFRNSPAQSS